MTDRDHFAAAALTGLLASGEFDGVPTHYSVATGHAYAWADAMIRERNERSRVDDTPEHTHGDIMQRLVAWFPSNNGERALDLMAEAAREIELLRRRLA